VLLLDGTNVNHTLVEDGWCWWYRKYAPRDTVLEGLEKEAREAKKGLWVDPQPVQPGSGGSAAVEAANGSAFVYRFVILGYFE
jgi:endonuclease YncB( thermonuclease family)